MQVESLSVVVVNAGLINYCIMRRRKMAHLLLISSYEGAALWQEQHAAPRLFRLHCKTLACGKVGFLIAYRGHLAYCYPGYRGLSSCRGCHASQSRSLQLAGRCVYGHPR